MKAPHTLTAVEAAKRLRTGDLTVRALAEDCLARIAARDGAVAAWSHLDPEHVLAEADRLGAERPRGLLHGIPVAIKDVIHTRDMPTGHGSPLYPDHAPAVDAACVATLRAAGALVFGKTVTTEFAASRRGGPTRNPHDPSRTPGGSSSGSAAAVADGQVTLALGTQTGGSTIRPASYTGVFAFKPTWGVISQEGIKPYAVTCDTLGFFVRAPEDLALLADAFALTHEEPAGFTLAGARIGLCRSPAWPQALPETQAALESGAALLSAAGAEVVPLHLPAEFDSLAGHHAVILDHEGRSAFWAEARTHPGRLADDLAAKVENRSGHDAARIRAAYDAAAFARSAFDEIAAAFDAVLAPSATGEAPEGLGDTGDPAFNAPWTFLHAPVANVPAFAGPRGLPVGLSLVGPRFADRAVLAAARAVAPVLCPSAAALARG